MPPPITSLQNPKIKNLVKLRQRRQRDRQKLMLIDGVPALRLGLKNNFPIDVLYFDQDKPNPELLQLAQAQGVLAQPVSPEVFQKIGYGDNPDGHLGLAAQPPFALENLPRPANPLYVIVEGLEKPGNLGAILRSADAAGVAGLIVCEGQTDICNPNVIRASRGAFFTVPIAYGRFAEVWPWLRQKQVHLLAASPEAQQAYTEVDMRAPTALVLGAEHAGLTHDWPGQTFIWIPMAGQVDSLNVAQAATILLFEAVRQRTGR